MGLPNLGLPSFGLMVLALAVAVRAHVYGLWADDAPGDGLFPFLAAVALFAALLADSLRHLGQDDGAGAVTPARLRVVGTVAALVVVYALVLPWAGFALATAGLLTVIAWRADPAVRLPRVAGVCSGLAVLTYVVFTRWLGVPLPSGLTGW
jgi:hypothetical protein